MALNHPRNLAAWREWQRGTSPLRGVAERLRRPEPHVDPALYVRGSAPTVLVAIESTTPSNVAANLRLLDHLDADAAVLAPGPIATLDAAPEWTRRTGPDADAIDGLRVAIASGNYLPMGATAELIARSRGARFVVVQHGLMTPFAPPLPEGAHLLAASEADAEFWRSGRDDVTSEVVGLQLLWDAAQDARERPDAGERAREVRPVYLGQLHGAELPRRDSARSAEAFCRATGANYRPHPSEIDRLSLLQHALWQRRGLTLDKRRVTLGALGAPVASVFSTGVLEAAARGLPAWVTFAGAPPAWLGEFWARYGMRRIDPERARTPRGYFDVDAVDATPAPAQPGLDPSIAIARAVERLAASAGRAERSGDETPAPEPRP